MNYDAVVKFWEKRDVYIVPCQEGFNVVLRLFNGEKNSVVPAQASNEVVPAQAKLANNEVIPA